MQYELALSTSVPVWVVKNCDAKPPSSAGTDPALYPQFSKDEFLQRWPLFRGVSLDNLLTVLATGVDVQPTNAPIYCSDFDKAWEYGGESMGKGRRMIFALDSRKLQRTFRILEQNATESEIAEVLETYPNRFEDEHLNGLWFSRMDSFFPGYEVPYGYWIPGDAKDALMAIFLFEVDREALVGAFQALRESIG